MGKGIKQDGVSVLGWVPEDKKEVETKIREGVVQN